MSVTIIDSVFRDNVGPHAVVDVVMVHKNDGDSYRAQFEKNVFRDNDVVQIMKFIADYDDACSGRRALLCILDRALI